jgi:hypothetical protein
MQRRRKRLQLVEVDHDLFELRILNGESMAAKRDNFCIGWILEQQLQKMVAHKTRRSRYHRGLAHKGIESGKRWSGVRFTRSFRKRRIKSSALLFAECFARPKCSLYPVVGSRKEMDELTRDER